MKNTGKRKVKNPNIIKVDFKKPLPPELRMKTYSDHGINCQLPSDPVWDKVRWTEFRIVVPTEQDKLDLQAALEYLHNQKTTNTDFIVVNQLVHGYLPDDMSIIVDEDLSLRLKQESCHHNKNFTKGGVVYCEHCWKALEYER